jgi:hypothetical protein
MHRRNMNTKSKLLYTFIMVASTFMGLGFYGWCVLQGATFWPLIPSAFLPFVGFFLADTLVG